MRYVRVVAVAIATMALLASEATAFEVDFALTPTTTQAGGHPSVTVALVRAPAPMTRTSARSRSLDLPPGLVGNPEATTTKCTQVQFQADTCPPGSEVGSVESVATAATLTLPPVPGTIYVLEPDPDDAGTLGIVVAAAGPRWDRQAVLDQPHQDIQDRRRRLRSAQPGVEPAAPGHRARAPGRHHAPVAHHDSPIPLRRPDSS